MSGGSEESSVFVKHQPLRGEGGDRRQAEADNTKQKWDHFKQSHCLIGLNVDQNHNNKICENIRDQVSRPGVSTNRFRI